MPNFHSDAWIQEHVMEHLAEAKEHFDEDHIVGIFYQGSGNYGLDYEQSDVDTKLITTPTLDELVFNKKPVSTTHVRANDEHIDFKDLRLYIETFRKQNLNFLEILFTPYKWVNPKYEDAWNVLVEHREEIAHLNEYLAVKAMQGVAKEKYHALEHPYPNKLQTLKIFGYDPKQLHHLLRIEKYLNMYIAGNSYEECLRPGDNWCSYLLDVKKGCFSMMEAEDIADKAIARIDDLCHHYFDAHENKLNEDTDAILRQVQYDIIHKSIKDDMENE